jgi:DNA gyrase subunit B
MKNGDIFKDEYYYAEGITDYIKEIVGDTALNTPVLYSAERVGRDRDDKKDYKVKINFAFSFSTEASAIEYYHNSSFLEHGGSPDKATRSAFVSAFEKYLKTSGKSGKKDSKIVFSDVAESLVLVVNSFSTQTSYENQTKKAITNSFIAKAMTDFFSKTLESFFAENPAETDKICQRILINKKSRESAEYLKRDVKKKLTTTLDINNTVEKFVPCRSKDPEICELYIVEGDSAMSSCKTARNSEFQAIMPVRGKTFNCLKANSIDKILQSDIITDLLKVIGCGVEIKGKGAGKFAAFDMKLLRWNKIIICTDADEDGYHIRTLILTLFYTLLPTLIKEGRIYIAETPLFEIVSKDKSYFAYNEAEKIKIIEKLGNAKYTIHRSKGLGENNADMMSLTTMAPATRRLVRIVPSPNEEQTDFLFNALLGSDIDSRKDYIAKHGARYVDMADV